MGNMILRAVCLFGLRRSSMPPAKSNRLLGQAPPKKN